MTQASTTRPAGRSAVRVLGIRHHGPGSARAVLTALDDLQPDRVLIEGPPEADALVPLVADPDLVPPVALLAYRNDTPAAAAFWPFAVFSPEWQALTWSARHQVPVAFMDLPAAVLLADRSRNGRPRRRQSARSVRTDPIAVLAEVAGYDDPERWWEDVIENRRDGDPFDAVTDAMTAVRADRPETDPRTLQREAHMRKTLRAAQKAGARRIAVVCGAWHAPALIGKLPTVTADNALLRGLPTAKVTATWVPWTHSRLAVLVRLRRWCRLARLVPAPVHRHRARPGAVDDPLRRGVAPARPADLDRPRHRGRPVGPRPGPAARSPGAGPDRGHRRDPRGAVRGQRDRRRVRPA